MRRLNHGILMLSAFAATAGFSGNADAEEIAPDGALVKNIEAYCKKIAPPTPKFVEYVDGYAVDSCLPFPDRCLGPLLDGYRYVEFEAKLDDSSRNIPEGKYSLEIVDAPNELCATFDAITNIPRSTRLKSLRENGKCVGMKRTPSFISKYSYAEELGPAKIGEFSGYIHSSRITVVATGKIVGETREVVIDKEGAWRLSCGQLFFGTTLPSIVIPSHAFAPLQQSDQ
ncbi:MAG: hypothetical protein U5J99_13005 [Parvularculaceae bacterium]|nr:hypothetical protein [Parvularculaceae bacterium]